MNDKADRKARALGINHVVLEVDDLDKALEFYGAIFDFKLRGKSAHNAFIDLGPFRFCGRRSGSREAGFGQAWC